MAFEEEDGRGSVQPVLLKLQGGATYYIFPTSYTERNHCKMIGSPSEQGLMQFDNKVIQPSTVNLTGIVKSTQVSNIDTLRRLIKSNDLSRIKCTFQGKGGTMENMIIESLEEVGESNRYDAVEVRITLQEYLEHNVSGK